MMSASSLPPGRFEAILTWLLFVGGSVSAALLMAGLALWFAGRWLDTSETLLHLGLITLMATPILRVLVSVGEYVRERDWWFVLATATVLATLFLSIWIAFSEAAR
jgi:uncharacterized membrane protein